jgi:hypothetical protein
MADAKDATPGHAGWVLIENEGALFRGPARGAPAEVWFPHQGWRPYALAHEPKPISWGDEITAPQALALMRRLEAPRG